MKVGQRVRFIKDARNDEWKKGQSGTLTKVLAKRPQATSDILLIDIDNGKVVWATHEDIERSFGDQLTLFTVIDILKK